MFPFGPAPLRQVLCCLALTWVVLAPVVQAQELGNLRTKRVFLDSAVFLLDTLSIAPGSLTLARNGQAVPAERYTLSDLKGEITWNGPLPTDTLVARYRVLPLLFTKRFAHKERDRLLAPAGSKPDPFKYVASDRREDLFSSSGLNKTGSISRGVLFGNNQDLSVNSTLNLELSGKITDRVNVLASITDNNIPVQADGNTAELQDFDQVFIKLFDENWELIAGDLVLQRPKSHFLTYLKKNQGLSFTQRSRLNDRARNEVGATAALSKGKFARNLIQGVEGVQGPYRLRGDQGESFIIVLSGTERVFIDGQLLLRGQEFDYVIDYNTAEISFTAKRLITKDRRIIVEFQYSERNYSRSMVRLDDTFDLGKEQFRLSVFSEQDHKNQPLQQSLTDAERQVLFDAGDDPLAAVVPGVDSVAFDENEVLYRQLDSLGYTPVYVFSADPELARFRVSFSNVGIGNGDYVQQEFTPNGRVFRWVAPDTVSGLIVRRGEYAPVRPLVTPRVQQVVTLGHDHRNDNGLRTSTELAYSRLDRNTFSPLDDGNDEGVAAFLDLEKAFPLGGKDTTLELVVGLMGEGLTSTFRPVERYRAVEFERDWNALTVPLDGDQLLAGASVGLRSARSGSIAYSSNTFQVRDRYSGWRQELVSDLRPGANEIIGKASFLSTREPIRTDFVRNKFRIARHMPWITVGIQDEHELNRRRADTTDQLEVGSYQFFDWEVFVQSPDTFRNKFRLSAGQRYDDALKSGELVRSTTATAYTAGLDLGRNPNNRFSTSLTYRQLRIEDSTLTTQRPEDTYLLRLDHDLNLGKGLMIWDLFYEFGSGLEQRRAFVYVEVPAGQGVYVWIDYNNNGIKELNEFELANFGYEANYLRVNVQTNDFVRAYNNQFSAAFDLRPAAKWGTAKGFRGFIGRFSDMASYRSDRRTRTDDLLVALDPFDPDPTDTLLTSFLSSVRNTLYYDRSSRTWTVDHTYLNDRTKTLLLNGFEARVREFDQFRIRWNTTDQWTADVEAEIGRVSNNSDLIEGRTFWIDQSGVRPRVTWRPNTNLRGAISFRYTDKRNREEFGGEAANIQDLGFEVRWSTAGKGSLQVNGNWVTIAYDGEQNSSLGNEMLSGLKVGSNLTWSVAIQRKLSNNLQIDLTYNGRSSRDVPVIHVGGAQVRAFF
ncbi:MAG: hypothetical protein KDB88_02470 [Flavobacteriales bacterium]|nr:hypothetical protein [Flavobacteriales bacterium]